jgi:hypothetical protein
LTAERCEWSQARGPESTPTIIGALREPGPGIAARASSQPPADDAPRGLLKERRRPHYVTLATSHHLR